MKINVLLFAIILLTTGHSIQVQGQDSQSAKIFFQKSDFRLVSAGGDLYRIETSEDSYFYSEEPDHPAVPYRSIDILVPTGAEIVNFDFSFESEEFAREIQLSLVDIPTRFSENTVSHSNGSTSAFSGDFPWQVVKFNSQQMMQGYTWLNFTIAPFLYDGNTGILSLIGQLDLRITYQPQGLLKSFHSKEKQVLQSVRDRVENPEDLQVYYQNNVQTGLKSSQTKLDYLIITTNALKKGFLPLIEWKKRKGLAAEILTLDEIYNRFDEPTQQLMIKRCLQEYYMERDLKWVLLGGDYMVVPVQPCFGSVGVDMVDNTIPADLFYACFDKSFDWNGNVDEKIGEPYWDYVDILPEVYIARAPVNNLDQVEVFVRKSIEYEVSPPLKNFAEKILLSGVQSWNNWEEKSDNHHWNEQMYRTFVASNWRGSRYGFYDTGTDFPGAENYQVTASNLSDQINNEYSVFHFAGHGNSKTIVMEEGLSFSVKEAFALKNKYPGIMLSSTCDVNAFDTRDPCLSEAFLRNPTGGCVAFWGSSRYGWGIPNKSTKLGPSFLYNAKFLEYLYKESLTEDAHSFAVLTSMAKAYFSGNGTAGGAYWYLQYALNAMGDPELSIYSQDPLTFDNVRIFSWENKLTVNTGGIENCRICVTSEDLAHGFQEVAVGSSSFTFDNVPELYQVTITKPNYIPYRYLSAITSANGPDFLSGFHIYPNPATDFIHIDFNLPEGVIYIYDLNGKIQGHMELSSGSNTVALSGLSKGTYILRLTTVNGSDHLKLIKQ